VQEQEQLIPLRDIRSERDEVRWKPAADGRIRSDRGDGAGSHGLGVALRAVDEESGEDGRDQRGTDETRRHGRKTVGMRLDRADTAVFGAAGARSAPARAPSITFADSAQRRQGDAGAMSGSTDAAIGSARGVPVRPFA
jgi:hypothetical protein